MRQEGRPPATAGPGDRLLIFVVVSAAALIGWIWVSGEIAARMARGRWPRIGPLAMLGVVSRLPRHAYSPGAAWPPSSRGAIPGPLAFYGTASIVLAVLVTAVWGLRRGVTTSAVPTSAPRRGGGAGWARPADLKTLRRGGRSSTGRLVLGRVAHSGVRRSLVWTERTQSILVVGPTQSGKTTGLAIPSMLGWAGPVVATSVKEDLVRTTLSWRSQQGPCWVFDPTGTTGAAPGSRWSPLSNSGHWSDAQRMASWLVEATPARSGLADAAFWYSAAAKQLAPMLLAACRGGLGMEDVVEWVNGSDFEAPIGILELSGDREASLALSACARRDERIRSSVSTTLETVLAPFEDPAVAEATRRSDIDLARLVDESGTLYLCGPTHEQQRVQGLFAALVSTLIAEAVLQSAHLGGPLRPPLLLLLDEVANIAPIKDLDSLASTGAGLGIQLVTICQDLAQLAARYGAERSRTIANNHRAKVLLSGVSDLGTLDLVSGLAGERAVRHSSVTQDLRDGRRTTSTSSVFRRLAPSDELRRIPPGQAVLVYGHLPPVRLRLRPWYKVRALRSKVGRPPWAGVRPGGSGGRG